VYKPTWLPIGGTSGHHLVTSNNWVHRNFAEWYVLKIFPGSFQGGFATPRRPGEVLPSSLQQDVMQVHMVVPDRLLGGTTGGEWILMDPGKPWKPWP